MKPLWVFVPGKPISQGSKVPGRTKEGKLFLREADDKNLRPWRSAVVMLIRSALVKHGHWRMIDRGAVVTLRFYFPRPPSVPKHVRPHMIVKPDIDKLTRAILDALTTAKIYADDAQTVELHVYKQYADDHPAGVAITVEEAGTQL